jgi:hypothetical protein
MSLQNSCRVAIVWAVLTLLFGRTAHPVFAQSDVGTLHVTIRNKQSGQIVPAMVCITPTPGVCRPTGASRRAVSPAHGSGPRWIATPFLCGSFIGYSPPVLAGVFPAPSFPRS